MIMYPEDLEVCKTVRTKSGNMLRGCVVTEEDMDKRKIVLFDKKGNEEFYDKTPKVIKRLRELDVIPSDRIAFASFISRELRSLKRRKEGIGFGTNFANVKYEDEDEV